MSKTIVGLQDDKVLSMDYVVNSSGTKLIDVIYPIGSIYMSFNSTSPSTLFGGTWEQITDRFLYCANSSGTKGGENSHTLTVAEMPSHTHDRGSFNITGGFTNWWSTINSPWGCMIGGSPTKNGGSTGGNSQTQYYDYIGFDAATNWSGVAGYTGSTNAHNNMPQYITCYAWHRTA